MGLGIDSREENLFHLVKRALLHATSFIEDTGDNKVTGESNLGNIPNSGIEVFGGAINTDVGEEVCWLDGVVSGTRSSEVVCGGDWDDHSVR